MKVIERLKTLVDMEKCGLSSSNTKYFSLGELRRACSNIVHSNLQEKTKAGVSVEIQSELIRDPSFPIFYHSLILSGMSNHQIGEWIEILGKDGVKMTEYSVSDFLAVEQVNIPYIFEKYQFLKYFSRWLKKEEWKLVAQNLCYFYTQTNLCIEQLSKAGINLLRAPFFPSLIFDDASIYRIFELLEDNPVLQTILNYLTDRDVSYHLNVYDLEHLKDLEQEDVLLVKELCEKLGTEDMSLFMERWMENDGAKQELERVTGMCADLSQENLRAMLDTQVGYLNALYANKLEIPFTEVRCYQTNVLIHAINHKANHFLKLVSENQELFLDLDISSLIFDEAFYTRCNLNSLTETNLKQSGGKRYQASYLELLKPMEYTFTELLTLRYAQPQYIELYNSLDIKRVDDRLIVIRQLLKHNLLPNDMEDSEIKKLAQMLSVKPFDQWMNQDLSQFNGLTRSDGILVLLSYDKIKRFFPSLQSWEEVVFAARNAEQFQNYNRWEEAMQSAIESDPNWQYLIKKMDFSDDFILVNQKNVIRFLMNDGAEMTKIYYDFTAKKEAFRRIVQAELMGQFTQLKYYEDDLQKEIDFKLGENQKKHWKANGTLSYGCFKIFEKDDYYTTLRLGTLPRHTCLSYSDGAHRECLLSGYDSNKKILLAEKNGIVVARAIIRLTKGAFRSQSHDPERTSLEFADLCAEKKTIQNTEKEYLTLFLERPYFSGLNENEQIEIEKAFASLIETKAANIGAQPVLSLEYYGVNDQKKYVRMPYYLYISKSKGGNQYLDSLSGPATLSSEGSYKVSQFLILQRQ